MEAGTLIGYFAERDEARRALRELQRRGFRRAALVHKTADGDVHIRDPFLFIIVDSQRYLGVKTCGESHISSNKKAPSKGLKDGV